MIRVTGSTMDRVSYCAASAALPAVYAPSSPEAVAGTEAHEVMEHATAGSEQAVDELGWDPRAVLPAGRHETEAAYWYNPVTDTGGRLLAKGRDYARAPEGAIPMRLDVVTFGDDGHITITDWKTGERFISPETLQLTVAALAVARAHGVDVVTVQIAQGTIGVPPKVRPRTLDVFDLDAAADQMRRIWERIVEARALVMSGRMPDVYPSEDACRYCPCWSSCPAHVAMARAVLAPTWDPANVAAIVDAMTPEEAGGLWLRLKSGEALLEAIGKALRAYAERSPLPLPDGKELAMVSQTQTRPVMAPTGETKQVTFLKAIQRKRSAA